eukprot:2440523-Pleurochrysis_carterae.AAC.2
MHVCCFQDTLVIGVVGLAAETQRVVKGKHTPRTSAFAKVRLPSPPLCRSSFTVRLAVETGFGRAGRSRARASNHCLKSASILANEQCASLRLRSGSFSWLLAASAGVCGLLLHHDPVDREHVAQASPEPRHRSGVPLLLLNALPMDARGSPTQVSSAGNEHKVSFSRI